MPVLLTRRGEKSGVLALIKRVICRGLDIRRELPLHADPAEQHIAARSIIKRAVIAILNRLAGKTVEAPCICLPPGPDRIERLADIRPIAHRYEPLQVKREVLAADPCPERSRVSLLRVADECQPKVKSVCVVGADRRLVERTHILELRE